MTEPPKPKTPRKGVLSRLNKLEIPLYRKKKKGPPTEAERTAAEFLSVQSGKIVEALDCGPDSGVAVVVEGDDAFIQVDIPSEPTGDGGDGNGAPKSPKLNLQELYKECFKAKESYESALNIFKAYEDKKSAGHGDAAVSEGQGPAQETEDSTRTFEQIEEDIKQMEKEVESAVDKLRGVKGERKQKQDQQWRIVRGLRDAFHNFGENARNVHSYVSLVPKSAGFGLGGLICGGINIVLKAAQRYVLMDKNMEHALKGIKDALVRKAYVFRRPEPDQRMHQLVSTLYASVFDVLELLLRWVYQQHTGLALLGALLKPDTYGRDLADRIASMAQKSGGLEAYGRNLELREVRKMQDVLMGMGKNMQGTVKKVLEGQSRQAKLLEGVSTQAEKTTEAVRDVGKKAQQSGDAVMAELKGQRALLERSLSKANVAHTFYIFVTQDPVHPRAPARIKPARAVAAVDPRRLVPGKKPPTTPANSQPCGRPPAPAAKPGLDAATVLADVGFRPDLAPADGRNILRDARLTPRDEQLAEEMLHHVRVRALVEAPAGAVLLVEGGQGARHEPRGPVAVAAARTVAALTRARQEAGRHQAGRHPPSVSVLAYFCSEHASPREGFGTALALVITLLLQLVDQHRAFAPELLAECRDAVLGAPPKPSAEDLEGFCELLESFVRALPAEATVFCVVEGLAFFEGPRVRTNHMRIVLETLLRLGREEGDGCRNVKCLFTTPARSPDFSALFEPYEILTLQIVNSSGFFRRNSWLMGRSGSQAGKGR